MFLSHFLQKVSPAELLHFLCLSESRLNRLLSKLYKSLSRRRFFFVFLILLRSAKTHFYDERHNFQTSDFERILFYLQINSFLQFLTVMNSSCIDRAQIAARSVTFLVENGRQIGESILIWKILRRELRKMLARVADDRRARADDFFVSRARHPARVAVARDWTLFRAVRTHCWRKRVFFGFAATWNFILVFCRLKTILKFFKNYIKWLNFAKMAEWSKAKSAKRTIY